MISRGGPSERLCTYGVLVRDERSFRYEGGYICVCMSTITDAILKERRCVTVYI